MWLACSSCLWWWFWRTGHCAGKSRFVLLLVQWLCLQEQVFLLVQWLCLQKQVFLLVQWLCPCRSRCSCWYSGFACRSRFSCWYNGFACRSRCSCWYSSFGCKNRCSWQYRNFDFTSWHTTGCAGDLLWFSNWSSELLLEITTLLGGWTLVRLCFILGFRHMTYWWAEPGGAIDGLLAGDAPPSTPLGELLNGSSE